MTLFAQKHNEPNIVIPTIETKRLCLIPPSAICFDVYEKFYTNAQASRSYGGPVSQEKAWARLKEDLGSWHLSGFGVWVIQQQNSREFIGTCGFWQGKGWPRELTWWLLPQARRKGFAFEASVTVVSHAYRVFGWDAVETYMNDDNVSARALAQRLGGFKVRRSEFPDGLTRDVFSIPMPSAQITENVTVKH